jgi:hypothetical protein
MNTQDPAIGVHLDLKYVMPHKAWLTRWVSELPELGINTLLLEYEDKFPFRKHPFLRAPGAFSEGELHRFLSAARGAGLRIVPLVQSLSHLEFALHHQELAHLREAPHITTQIDTSNPQARQFVLDLMDEVLAFHEPDEWFHIGGDEAWHLGHNPRTKLEVERVGPLGVWAEVMGSTARAMLKRGKRPILWDDILWKQPEALARLDIPREAIVHCWSYGHDDGERAVAKLCQRVEAYHAAGHQALAAPCLNWGVVVPRHDHCLKNTRGWALAARQTQALGMINTAWACFHVLPPAQALQIAATGRLMRDTAPLPQQWYAEQLGRWFGVSESTGGSAARGMERCTAFWEQPVPGLARPITPNLYGYMDMLAGVFRDQGQRAAEGAYPPDPNSIDFAALSRRKLDILRAADRTAIVDKLQALEQELSEARNLLEPLGQQATRHREEAAYFATAARLKHTHILLLQDLVSGQVNPQARQAWLGLGPALKQTLTPLVEPAWLDWLPRAWWQGWASLLD